MNRVGLYAQAIRGPILLIAVGVLFAMHQAGLVSFARSWPLLVIVIGLLKLIETLAGPSYPQPPFQQPGGRV